MIEMSSSHNYRSNLMQHSYNDTQLTIFIDESERQELRAMREDDFIHFQSDAAMYEIFEPLIANSDLDWIDPSETGDLTSAPMLGVRTDSGVMRRWAFMDYQVRSPLEDLLAKGKCIFIA